MGRPGFKFQPSCLEHLVAESRDYFSVLGSPDCWEAFNIPTSMQRGASPSLPPLVPFASLLEANPGYFLSSLNSLRGISSLSYSRPASNSIYVPRIPSSWRLGWLQIGPLPRASGAESLARWLFPFGCNPGSFWLNKSKIGLTPTKSYSLSPCLLALLMGPLSSFPPIWVMAMNFLVGPTVLGLFPSLT